MMKNLSLVREHVLLLYEDTSNAKELFDTLDTVGKVGVFLGLVLAYTLYRRLREFDEKRDGINKYDKF